MTQKLMHGPGGTIPDKTAEEYARNWRHAGKMEKLELIDHIKGFVIPKEDIDRVHAIMKHHHGEGCRVYFGIQGQEAGIGILRFMIVPMDKHGKDILHKHPDEITADEDGSTVYDFTRPCPTQCDCDSPMNGEECSLPEHEVEHHELHA